MLFVAGTQLSHALSGKSAGSRWQILIFLVANSQLKWQICRLLVANPSLLGGKLKPAYLIVVAVEYENLTRLSSEMHHSSECMIGGI